MEIRTVFHKHLREIQDDILAMGSMVSKATLRSIEALKKRDLELAHQIIADDRKVNNKRFEIEEKCIALIATQQPMASDLRVIVAILNIITEIERIGDYAAGIAKIVILIGDDQPLKPLIDIPRMADQTVDMLRRSLDAFVNREAEIERGSWIRQPASAGKVFTLASDAFWQGILREKGGRFRALSNYPLDPRLN